MTTLSINSNATKLLKGSEGESRIQWGFVVPLVLGVGLTLVVVNFLWGYNGSIPFVPDRAAATLPGDPGGMASAIITPTVAVYSLPEPTPTLDVAQAQAFVELAPVEAQIVEVEVTREVYYEIPGPEVEVTRIVEVIAQPLPTVTPIPLAAGTVEICVSVEGAKALYIGNEGVVSGACKVYAFGVGQTTILVQVDR